METNHEQLHSNQRVGLHFKVTNVIAQRFLALVRFEAFTANKCNEVLSRDELCKYDIVFCFGDCLCFYHQGLGLQ
jgi:hypothetical protein